MGLGLAFKAFFRALRGGEAAKRIREALAPQEEPGKPALPAAEPAKDKQTQKLIEARSALLMLSTMQEKGRLIDFLEEDLDGLEDADIGAAVRAVHAGCKEALAEYFELAPLAEKPEGESMEVDGNVDPSRVKLIGTGSPPVTGKISHRGWQAVRVELPTMLGEPEGAKILAPIQIDLG